jgi:cellulose synthase/poly-beta-1,6-N-acetylglucosamine synthase-like glycosyltransferase
MMFLFYFLLLVQLVLGISSLRQGLRWLHTARRRVRLPAGFYMPRVALLCPVKGLEPGLEENLTALTQFDYVAYEIFFAVANPHDSAHPLLQRIAAAAKRPVHIVVAGAARDCGEKVNNLRAAVEKAGAEFDVLVFADSDGRPPRRWLAHLVAPLAEPQLGAATTFRWLLPHRGGFWSALVSAWNAPVATYLGEHSHNFCWGGGTAIRRDRFEEIHALEAWHGSVSDDFSLTRALGNAGYAIAFVPECLVASTTAAGAHQCFEFTNRQMIITRVYAPKIWTQALIGHGLYSVTVLLGLGLWARAWFVGLPSLQILLLALVPPLLAATRGVLRQMAVLDLMLEWREQLLRCGWAWTLLAPLVPFLFFYNALVATFRRTITWRGIRYRLVSPRETRVNVR